MFTGIIEEIGIVKELKRNTADTAIAIETDLISDDIHLGDSIAVNGVCLTVSRFANKIFWADVMNETLSRSNLGLLKSGVPVNLERAMAANGRFGGHMVSGHIDGTGTLSATKNDGNALWYTISTSKEILHYIVEKGSIAIDGISLTVAKVNDTSFSVSTIPHTRKITTLSQKKVGDIINLENDIFGKYVEKFNRAETCGETKKSTLSKEFLINNGF